MSDLWYAAADIPTVRCVVRVIRDARIYTAVYWTPPGSKRLAWGVPLKGPPATARIEFYGTGWAPDAWQPMDARAWVWPDGVAPTPLVTPPDRMWSERMSFGAVEAATGAELAREMEHNRAAMGSGHPDDAPEPECPQNWRNVYTVKYEPVGHVTRGHLEARVCRALCYDKLIPDDIKHQRSNAAVLADLKQWFDNLGKDPTCDYRPPFVKSQWDHDDYLKVMGWIANAFADRAGGWKGSREEEIFKARIVDPPRTWDEIGRWYALSRGPVKKRYDRALDRILVQANSAGPSPAQMQIDNVRGRNRAHKRRAVA